MKKVLAELRAPHWELGVWSTDVARAQARLSATMVSRGKAAPMQGVRIVPAAQTFWDGRELEGTVETHRLGSAVFFENHSYEFEFSIPDCSEATVRHRSQRITEAFRFDNGLLRGTLNFGNDVGWFSLGLVIRAKTGEEIVYTVAFEIYPTKMDMASDMQEILTKIDATYPLWRFSYGRATDQEMDRRRRPFERFPLLWLEQFKSLRGELEANVRLVCNAPHHRLMATTRRLRLEQLRGKLSPRQERRVAEALRDGEAAQRIEITSRRLSVDTPENRFVRSVLEYCDRELGRFQARLQAIPPVKQEGLSRDARREISDWRAGIRNLLSNRLWNDVGKYQGLHRESLVLQERTGYSGVYRVWLQLRMYLDVLGRHASISMKTIAELYEVWCFLEIRRQLLLLGFAQTAEVAPTLDYSGLEVVLSADGMGAALHFQRGSFATGDLVKLRLAHEPLFGARNRNSPGKHVVSWLHVQKPDIVVEATFPNGEILFWVFDAKYRVHRKDDSASESREDDSTVEDVPSGYDLAPADAINQMHRYRDAIVHAVSDGRSSPELSRPVIGAFCLFPGWYPDAVQKTSNNPYKDAIEAVSIGAFPALPGQDNPWLANFLASQLGPRRIASLSSPGPEWQRAQWGPRIQTAGLTVQERQGLVLLAHIGGHRTDDYMRAFRDGLAGWYHVREKAIRRGEISPSAMRDVTHCAVAWPARDGTGSMVTHVYRVRSQSLVDRSEISALQAGTNARGSDDKYWLFELGKSVRLESPVKYERASEFRVWVTSLETLTTARDWSDIVQPTAETSRVEPA